jgi:NADH dehydrogenase (ubiquinone) 1 alpha subcomplex subunit 9
MLEDDTTASQTYELYGPRNYSTAEIAELVDKEIIKQRRHFNVPKRLLKPFAYYLNKYLWWHTLSADEVEREFMDQVIDKKAKTFKDLGIEPAELSNLTFHYLVSRQSRLEGFTLTNLLSQQGYRSSSYYDLPPATEREKREEKKYFHVVDDQ